MLRRGARVAGFVLGPDAEPLERASLYIGFSQFAYNRLDALSAADGSFEFPNVGAGSQILVAQYTGLAPVTRSFEIPSDARSVPDFEIQ